MWSKVMYIMQSYFYVRYSEFRLVFMLLIRYALKSLGPITTKMQEGFLHMLMSSKVMQSYLYASYRDIGGQVTFVNWVLYKKLKSNENQTQIKRCNRGSMQKKMQQVKGHVELFFCKLLWYWSSGQLKSNYNQS